MSVTTRADVPISTSGRFLGAIERFDAANAEDPNREVADGLEQPAGLLYARRMTFCLNQFRPDAPETVRLAARCQHIRRWTIPRINYPEGRNGYRRWRADLARFHASTAASMLKEVGYDSAAVSRVESLLLKERLKTDPDVQLLEDVICLVFLKHYLTDFVSKHTEEKLIGILRKTWRKMSDEGRQTALRLDFDVGIRALVEEAVALRE